MVKKYNKLVRDRIPEIIEASGKTCVFEVLTNEEYLEKLELKLEEELAEYKEEKDLEELADLLEVIYALAVARGSSKEKLEEIRLKKVEERGTFENKLLLKEVKE
ncbi:MAG: nucleoside triphosphate pyrophosphohydrolase [Clostridiales bacterium]|nr:nucleoside triphosphate pyrophosphohydrolase [Clostridiales bacterium]